MALEPGCLLPLLISHISPPFLADTIINRSTVLGKGRVRERHERGMGERGGKIICKKKYSNIVTSLGSEGRPLTFESELY